MTNTATAFQREDAASPLFIEADDRQALAERLAGDIADWLGEGIAGRDAASIAVSGGSTPKPMFNALRGKPLDWKKVTITLADERWVEPDHPDSNEKLVRENLLAEGAHFVGLKNKERHAAEGVAACAEALQAVPLPFDVVVLGMGGDGHTASLFPEVPALQRGLDPLDPAPCLAVTPPEYAPHERMSLSLSALLNAKRIVLHITGEDKKDVLKKAMEDGPAEALPIRAILRQDRVPVFIYWAA